MGNGKGLERGDNVLVERRFEGTIVAAWTCHPPEEVYEVELKRVHGGTKYVYVLGCDPLRLSASGILPYLRRRAADVCRVGY